VEVNHIVEKIDSILPQTQCGQCSYTGCMPYANAISKGEAEINQCPPGGEIVIRALAELMNVKYKPLDESYGISKPKAVAFIDEDTCIGCTFCIQACPVDAILGAAKQMHTIIEKECTGCELCLAPCPVDCITMPEIKEIISDDIANKEANIARKRNNFRILRLEREKIERAERNAKRKLENSKGEKGKLIEEKRVEIAAAVSRTNNGEIN
jgi:electron transport complex protein RnfB